MPIQKALKEALKMPDIEDSEQFHEQIKKYQDFKRQLDDAGIVQNKKQFSIPLIERIGSLNYSS